MELFPERNNLESQIFTKVLCLSITSLAQGGAEKQCLLLAEILKKNYTVFIVVISPDPVYPPFQKFLTDKKIDYINFTGNFFKKIIQFRKILKQKKVDIILSYLPKDTFYSMLAGYGIVATHIGGIRNANMSFWKRKVLQWMHNYHLNGTIANCLSGKQFFTEKGFNPSKITVIHNGISTNTPLIERENKDVIHICSLGRLVGQKDFATAIKAIEFLLNLSEVPSTVFLSIVGSGPDEKPLRDLIENQNLSHHIRIITNIPDVSEILKQSDIYLCTSLFEGISNAIMEAMTYSLPVVATDAGDNHILVRDNENGFIRPIGDYIGIGNALRTLVLSHELRIKFGQESHRLIKENFSLEYMEQQYRNYLEKWM